MDAVLVQSGGIRCRENSKLYIAPGEPLITIVTVVFNGRHVLENAIRSVIGQSFDAKEYLVVDGGSTDGTVDLLRRYDGSIDYWISEPDGGIYDAMNKARKLAHGQWIYFLGADDVMLPILEVIASKLKTGAVCYGDVRFAGSGHIYDGSFNRYKMMQQNISHQAIFYPRSIYVDKAYDTRVKIFADYKYNIELMGAGTPFAYIAAVVCVFNENGQSSRRDDLFLGTLPVLIRRNFGLSFYLIKLFRNQIVKIFKGTVIHRLSKRLISLLRP